MTGIRYSKFFALLFLAGCSREDADEQPAPPTEQPQPAAPVFTAQLDARDLAFPRTNTSTTPRFVFSMFLAHASQSANIVAALSEQGRFESAAGEPIGLRVTSEPDKSNPNEVLYDVQPAVELAEDTWYWLVVENTQGLRVGPEDARWSTRFYTSSAPHIVHMELSKGILYARLSEAVDLNTVDAARLLRAGTKYVTGCALDGEACVAGADPQWVSAFNVKAQALDPTRELALEYTGAWKGSGRAMAEIPFAAGTTRLRTIAPESWIDCQDGHAKCWSAPFDGALPASLR